MTPILAAFANILEAEQDNRLTQILKSTQILLNCVYPDCVKSGKIPSVKFVIILNPEDTTWHQLMNSSGEFVGKFPFWQPQRYSHSRVVAAIEFWISVTARKNHNYRSLQS